MNKNEINISVISNERITKLLQEAELELSRIKPEIEYLLECQKKLSHLKEQEFKLSSLIISLKSINKIKDVDIKKNNVVKHESSELMSNSQEYNAIASDVKIGNMRMIFIPDVAISEVKKYLRTKNNLNYEIYKAVVFNSGEVTTEELKTYLVENNIKQPKTGKGFKDVELKEISSRVNYLVRKGVLSSPSAGSFRTVFGWSSID